MRKQKQYTVLLAFWAFLMSEGCVIHTDRMTSESVSLNEIDVLIERFLEQINEE